MKKKYSVLTMIVGAALVLGGTTAASALGAGSETEQSGRFTCTGLTHSAFATFRTIWAATAEVGIESGGVRTYSYSSSQGGYHNGSKYALLSGQSKYGFATVRPVNINDATRPYIDAFSVGCSS